ncbi:elongation factor P maturation arginine rhamnosyltransferase EarP [soil metagenome]
MTTTSCDIFCRVVDNYGDIGVCWRLARQLRHEHGWQVRLVVDDLRSFAFIAPPVQIDPDEQTVDGVVIQAWRDTLTLAPAQVVIEAFACDPPEAYVQAMAAVAPTPLWLNLDYLATEPWALECQWMTSPHPRLPLIKHFVFPGFDGTLALLVEADLEARRSAAHVDADGRRQRLAALGADPDADTTVFVFSYPTPALEALVDAADQSPGSTQWLLAPTAANRQLLERRATARTRLVMLDPVPQPRFDEWLWLADLILVRGEDSFVRAQLAVAPFLWQAYPQADAAHWDKLEAFAHTLERFAAQHSMLAGHAVWWSLQQAWNRDDPDRSAWRSLWRSFIERRAEVAALMAAWRVHLLGRPSLADQIAAFQAARL